MKRINVHLNESTIQELDKLSAKLKEGEYWRTSYFNRADLIRYAIGKTFGLSTGYTGNLEEKLAALKAQPIKKEKKK